jgi:hypothetical protein
MPGFTCFRQCRDLPVLNRVARWFVQKMLVYFKDILRSFAIFYGLSAQFVVIWYIFPVLVFCTKKNLATLLFKTMPRFYLVSILSTAFQLNLGLTARVSLSGSLMSKISEKNGGKKVSGGKIAK